MSNILSGIFLILIGVGLNALYAGVARRKFGVNIDFVQAVMYKVDTSRFPFRARMLEFSLRWLKLFGIIMAIVGGIIIVTPK